MKIISIILISLHIVSSRDYKVYDLEESHNLCEQLHRKKLRLGVYMPGAIRILLYSRKPFHCQFEVKAKDPDHGVVAVIQDMNFRKDEITGECIDYIAFRGSIGDMSRKFCGTLDVESAMENYVIDGVSFISNAVENSFQHDVDDPLTVIIHMNMQDREYDYFTAGMEIVFTNFKECDGKKTWQYKPCVNVEGICMEDIYFEDGFVNCPFRGCVDEGTCIPHAVKYYGKRVVAGVVTGFVVALTLSFACIYFCTPEKRRSIDFVRSGGYMFPPLKDTDLNEDAGKDDGPPPVYESLFPTQPHLLAEA